MKIMKTLVTLGLTLIVLSSFVVPGIGIVSVLSDEINGEKDISLEHEEEILYDHGSFEETSKLPLAPSTDFIDSQQISQRSLTNPSNIEDYKNLGYTNFSYSSWAGDKAYLSTKSKRVAEFIVG
ncbi:MAG TPA: hypothetical protein H9829_04165 [Candidatus Tetragenococcus pullicola]|nr:hypothetical protein [Candidatus Tetragenococcus pullicola]